MHAKNVRAFSTQKSMRHLSFIDQGQPGRQCDSAVAAGRRWLPLTGTPIGVWSQSSARYSSLIKCHAIRMCAACRTDWTELSSACCPRWRLAAAAQPHRAPRGTQFFGRADRLHQNVCCWCVASFLFLATRCMRCRRLAHCQQSR
jgi:hypothetical protein